MAKPEKTQPDKIDALYQWLSFEVQQARDALMAEVRMSSAQIGSLYSELKSESEKASSAVSQEIRYSYKQNQTIYDGLASMLTKEVGERLTSMEEKLAALEQLQVLLNELNELKYNYMTLQSLCGSTNAIVANELNPKLDAIGAVITSEVNPKIDALNAYLTDEVAPKLAVLEAIEGIVSELNAKLEGFLPTEEDYKKLADAITEKTEESVATHSAQVLEAVAAIPVAENVDYTRIVEEVGDKLLDILNQLKNAEPAPVDAKIDYDRIIFGAAEKVVESLPAPEKVDYSRIENAVAAIDMDALAEAVAAKIVIPVPAAPEIDYDRLAEAVAAKIVIPVPAAPEIDYDRLAEAVAAKIVIPVAEPQEIPEVDYEAISDLVVSKIAVPEAPEAPEVDYEKLSDLVIEKMTAETEQTCEVVLDDAGIAEIAARVADKLNPEAIDYDKVCQAAQAAQILPDPVDYDRIAEIVEDKLAGEEPTYDLVIDEEGISAIAKGVSEEICQMCASCEMECEEPAEEAPVEEVAEEVVEETVAPVEEPVEEESVEEETAIVDEVPAAEELAAAVAVTDYEELGDDLVDAETGLVIRLKRSFTAKMKQSEEKVKGYYSDLKNALTSYKKINSNISWHGDRFNYGRETVAKINICGKTLCFYLALDPNDPEFKTTVYHQKDVSGQKAYESTPFMVKIKSDAAAKKALRLVGYLAEKLGSAKIEGFEEVDYVSEFAYESTKQLFDEGFIKATKEKKVDLKF